MHIMPSVQQISELRERCLLLSLKAIEVFDI